MLLRGCIRLFIFYDVGEAFVLDRLRPLVAPRGAPAQPDFSKRAPEYVRFENPPIVEPCEPLKLRSGETLACSLKYYEYAIVEAQLEVPFEGTWEALMEQTSRWMDAPDVEPESRAMVRQHLQKTAAALIRPRDEWLQESYLVVDLQQMKDYAGRTLTGEEILATYSSQIGQILRGEQAQLARSANERLLQGSLSYYSTDLLVVGFNAALIYDRPEETARTIQILEYARVQLLEFRYYDNFMSRVLADVYTSLDRKQNVLLSRWDLPRQANRLNTIRLDVMDLTERIDNAVKFVSDSFHALAYRMAASRAGVTEYRDLVEKKLKTAGELYDFMMAQFNETRLFLLEAAITILCLMDVILLFRGR